MIRPSPTYDANNEAKHRAEVDRELNARLRRSELVNALGLWTYADDTAAAAGGLTSGDIYWTGYILRLLP